MLSRYENNIQVWNVTTGVCEKTLEGHSDIVNSVAISDDGSRVVSGSCDKTVRVWNVTTGVCEKTLEGHSDMCECSGDIS